MTGLFKYRKMQLTYVSREVRWKLFNKWSYLPSNAMSRLDCNIYIADALKSGRPFMVSRFGSQEARATAWGIGVARGYGNKIPSYVCKRMALGPGFFPSNDSNLRAFSRLMVESCSYMDLLGYWDSFMQQYLLEEICPSDVATTELQNLNPFNNLDFPWSSALEDKVVLVVHPFAKTIVSQYSRRKELFPGTNVLPAFSLKTLIPPQTIAGNRDTRFNDWFEALDWLISEVDKETYDVALIGCGAYGLPLAAHVKKVGKQAIHLGGSVQILFGIKGKRWDSWPTVNSLYNDYWVRPDISERPNTADSVEKGCYW